jgi:hypothetical protein
VIHITYIYFLHKGDNIPFYIGKSNNPFKHRLHRHKKHFGDNTQLEILDSVFIKEWKFWEVYWIHQFKSWGFILKNKNNGGGGSNVFTNESKQKITLAKIGKSSGNKSRNKGRIITKEENKKRSLKLTGTKRTEETKQKMALIRKQQKLNTKPIIQLDKNLNIINKFQSITDAVNETKIKGIGNALTGLAKTAGGFVWRYKK